MANRISIPKSFAANPRTPNDFSIDPRSIYEDFNKDVDQQRYQFYDIEGDAPAPSSIAPELGILQYFYLENLEYQFLDYIGVTRNNESLEDKYPIIGTYFHQWENGTVLESTILKTPNTDSFTGTINLVLRRDMPEVGVTVTITGKDVNYTNTFTDTLDILFDVRDTGTTTGKISFRPLEEYTFSISNKQENVDFIIDRTRSDEDWEAQGPINDLKPTEASTNTVIMNLYNDYDLIDNYQTYKSKPRDFSIDPNYGGTYSDLVIRLDNVIKNDIWLESGTAKLANDFIKNAYIVSGAPWYYDANDANNFWSAAFVGYNLHRAGFPALRTQSSLNYSFYGREIDWRSWKNVRINDIVVFKAKEKSGGHVGFIKDFNQATNEITILNGNSANTAKLSIFIVDNVDMYVRHIKRNWPDPGIEYKLPSITL